jgi:transposase
MKPLVLTKIWYCKGNKYATIVYDLKKAHVVWVGNGKDRETVYKFLTKAVSDYKTCQHR